MEDDMRKVVDDTDSWAFVPGVGTQRLPFSDILLHTANLFVADVRLSLFTLFVNVFFHVSLRC